jgi:hypothetical protein
MSRWREYADQLDETVKRFRTEADHYEVLARQYPDSAEAFRGAAALRRLDADYHERRADNYRETADHYDEINAARAA